MESLIISQIEQVGFFARNIGISLTDNGASFNAAWVILMPLIALEIFVHCRFVKSFSNKDSK